MFMFSFFHKQITRRAVESFKRDFQKTSMSMAPAAPFKKCLKV